MTSDASTKEPQYEALVTLKKGKGLTTLGMMNNQVWHDDPRRLVFTLSRYKFVAKLLAGKQRALEVGCGDAFASRIVKQEVESLTVLDFDPIFVADIQSRADPLWPMHSAVHDMLSGPYPGTFDAIYCLDVLEHIEIDRLSEVLKDLSKITINLGFFSIHMGPAAKVLPDGRNAHLIQKPSSWWLPRLSEYFEILHLQAHQMMGEGIWVIIKPKILDD
jgi:SAM-dependent methyltransferase